MSIKLKLVFVLLGWLLLASFQLKAQNSAIPKNIQQLIEISQKSILQGDTTRALNTSAEALKLAASQDEYVVSICKLNRAKVMKWIEKYDDAYQNYWEAFSFFNNKTFHNESIEPLYEIGKLFEINAIYSKALFYYYQADSLLDFTTQITYRIPLKHSLGFCEFSEKKYSSAQLYFEELKAFAIQYQNIAEEMFAIRYISNCYAAMSDYPKAIQVAQTLIPKLKVQHKHNDLAKVYYRLGSWYMKLNKFDKALEMYDLIDKRSLQNDSLKMVIHYHQAEASLNLKSYSHANLLLLDLFRSKTLYQYPHYYAKSLNLWVLIPYFQNDNADALKRIDSLTLKVDKFEDINDQLLLINTLSIFYESIDSVKLALKYQKRLYALQRQLIESDKSLVKQNVSTLKNINQREKQFQLQNAEKQRSKLELEKDRISRKQQLQSIELFRSENEKLKLQQINNDLQEARQIEQLIFQNELLETKNQKAVAQSIITENKTKEVINKAEMDRLNQEKTLAEERNQRFLQNRKYLLIIFAIIIISFLVLLRGFLLNKKLNSRLSNQNQMLEQQKEELAMAIQRLKETQNQLIESERMASLGQLTAGIAHEIRNPLNFVNNFSSLIHDLLQEIEETLKQIQIPEGELKTNLLEVLQLIADNNDKVNKHGNRASQIISRMLSASSGTAHQYELTDLNLLVSDSAKLAYQGFRGEHHDVSFDLIFDLDPRIQMKSVIHQDLGRVFINIVNNACYALKEKMQTSMPNAFKPQIKISTKEADNDYFSISIEDNGKGMSHEVLQKIFNPFFTTKPTGKGTGLGLTMTYDIVTKMHQGQVQVESEVNQFTRFIISIPNTLK
jgi:signal transduction histidine kinase